MKALVIIPTYNERDNVVDITGAILEADERVHVLVVDDNSPDGTAELVERRLSPRLHLIKRDGKMGLGTAYVAGFKWAIEHGYDAVMEMDADFSHDPHDVPRLLDALDGHDLVIGSRYKSGVNVVNWPLMRLVLSYAANVYAQVVTGVPISDLTGGFKAIRTSVLKRVGMEGVVAGGYAFQIEMNTMIYRKGGRVTEIPIVFTERRLGVSKMSKRIILEALWLVPLLRVRMLLGRL